MYKELIKKINDSPYKVFFTITGGGTSFLGEFLSIAGGSNTVIGAYIPYSKELFDKYLGKIPEHYSTPDTARKLALTALINAVQVTKTLDNVIGFAVTCSLVADNEREGRKHKVSISYQTGNKSYEFFAILENGRTRAQEEELVKRLIFNILAMACGIDFKTEPILKPEEIIADRMNEVSAAFINLRLGKLQCVTHFSPELLKKERLAIYSGSFDELHEGHLSIAESAEKILGIKPYFEISILNPDKLPLDYLDIKDRSEAIFEKKYEVIFSNASLFIEKIALYKRKEVKELIFIVGLDTFARLWNPKHYKDTQTLLDFEKLALEDNVKFLVFSRSGRNIDSIEYDKELLKNVPQLIYHSEEAKNFNISANSTEIRKKKYVD